MSNYCKECYKKQEEIEQLKQTLQEIREIAVNEYYAVDDDARYITDKILAKINEVIGVE